MSKSLTQQIADSLAAHNIEDKIPEYQVWILLYYPDKPAPLEMLVKTFKEPQPAVDLAKTYTEVLANAPTLPETQLTRCEILVETVVDFEEYDENIVTLYQEVLEF